MHTGSDITCDAKFVSGTDSMMAAAAHRTIRRDSSLFFSHRAETRIVRPNAAAFTSPAMRTRSNPDVPSSASRSG